MDKGLERDDVLHVEDSSASFSGFSSVDSEDELPIKTKTNGEKKKKTVKSVVVKPGSSKKTVKKPSESGKTKAKKSSDKPSKSNDSLFDLNSLSESDIIRLRGVLGIESRRDEQYEEPQRNFEDWPNLNIEIDSRDLSDVEQDYVPKDIGQDLNRALFNDSVDENNNDTEGDVWNLPKLKTPQKGKAIPQSLADLINMACTSQCDVDSVVSKYHVPINCEKTCPPLVNNEVWKIMDKRTQSQDRGVVDIQNLVATGLMPVIKLASVLKTQIAGNSEAKDLISDALIVLGQVQYMLSIKRRYMIRPNLKKKFHSLCNISMPVTTKLFGDDVAKEIKTCESLSSIGKDQRFPMNRGRGNFRGGRRPYGSYSGYQGYGNRYSPYPSRGQGRPGRMAGYRIPKRSMTATSTVTAPNEQN